jgi:hypothetical protein
MKTMKTRRIFFIFALLASFNMQAQNFADYFTNKTLRIDYLLNGDAQKQNICLDELSSLPQWAGRRHRLAELPLKGNGQTIVTDSASGKEIYATSFSSLFTEWLSTDEAKHVAKGFEHTVLVPYPLRTVRITTTLYNSHQEIAAQIVHFVNPTDILIHAKGTSHITPYRYLLHSGNSDKCIDVAILGEGYTTGGDGHVLCRCQDSLRELVQS